jgi:hypothetical protein
VIIADPAITYARLSLAQTVWMHHRRSHTYVAIMAVALLSRMWKTPKQPSRMRSSPIADVKAENQA